jgi:hypothetical protein
MIIKVHSSGKFNDERRMNQGMVAAELTGAIFKLISRPVRSGLPNFERDSLKLSKAVFPSIRLFPISDGPYSSSWTVPSMR